MAGWCYNFKILLKGKKLDFSHLLVCHVPQIEKLEGFGFCAGEKGYVIERKLDEEFYAVVKMEGQGLWAEVFESASGEKYGLVDVKRARGAFVNGIRAKVGVLMDEILEKCFESWDLKYSYVRWIEDELGIKGDFPWSDEENYQVFRNEKSKWFGLVMDIKYKNLGFDSDEKVWVVNLKADPEKIPELVDKKSIFPAWHMNKKYWITVVLSGVTDFEKLKMLTLRSRELVR